MNWLEHRIPPPLLFAMVAVIMWVIAQLTDTVTIDPMVRLPVALLFFVAAGLCGPPAIAAFGRAKTTINPVDIGAASALVTSGVFRYTRNPMYVSMAALLIALTVYLAAPWAILGPIGFVLFITRFQIIPEEQVMRAKFGKAYEDYRQQVRRWL